MTPTPNGRPAAQDALRTPRSVHPPDNQKRGLLAEWRRLARVLDDPAVELDLDTVAPLFACYQRMTAAGLRIDAMAASLVRQLAYQLATSDTFLDG